MARVVYFSQFMAESVVTPNSKLLIYKSNHSNIFTFLLQCINLQKWTTTNYHCNDQNFHNLSFSFPCSYQIVAK